MKNQESQNLKKSYQSNDNKADKEVFYTIREFSEIVGKTPQSIYKRLSNNNLQQYIKVENGLKTISSKALSLFDSNLNIKGCQTFDKQQLNTHNQKVENFQQVANQKIEQLEEENALLKSQNSFLLEQIAVKDNEIEKLNNSIDSLLKANLDQQQGLMKLIDQSQQLTGKLILLEQNAQQNTTSDAPEGAENDSNNSDDKNIKKGLFGRFKGKK